MSTQMATLRNMIESIPRPWPIAQDTLHLAPRRPRPNPSVTDMLYSRQNHAAMAGSRERSLRGIFSAGMIALRGLFTRVEQRAWQGSGVGLQRNIYPTPNVAAKAGRIAFSPLAEKSPELIDAGDFVTGEVLDEDHPLPPLVDSQDATSPVSPSFEETIVASWARVAQESRALGMPIKEDIVGYLQTRAHIWGGDETETNNLIHKYADKIDPEKHADYGTMPKDVGYAWAHSTLLYHEDEDIDVTRDSIKEEMKKWGWNDAAVAVIFGEIAQEKEVSEEANPILPVMMTHEPKTVANPAPNWKHVPAARPAVQSPEQVAAASIHGGGNSGTIPPKKTNEPEGWRKWLPLSIAGGVILAVVGVIWGGDAASHRSEPAPLPSPSATASSSPTTETTSDETPGGDTNNGDHEGDSQGAKYSDATKNMDNVRKADDGRLFVDATKWTPRRTTTYPSFWNLAGEQIRANKGGEPTMREYVFVKNALLRVNHETEASARQMRVGQDMLVLNQDQYETAIKKANA